MTPTYLYPATTTSHPSAHLPAGRIILATLIILGLAATTALAGEFEKTEKLPMSVSGSAICEKVEDRAPIGKDTLFLNTIGKLSCFTPVYNAGEPKEISHVWYHEDKKRCEVKLTVQGLRWRTWSNVTIPKGKTGMWRVEVLDHEGKKLDTLTFEVIRHDSQTSDEQDLPL